MHSERVTEAPKGSRFAMTSTDQTTDNPREAVTEAIDTWAERALEKRPLRWSDARFLALARRVFRHQFETNAPYRSYCLRKGVRPGDVGQLADIPAVSTEVFKHVDLVAGEGDSIERVFRTSGTTRHARGEHHFGSLDVYRASLRAAFQYFCHPANDSLRIIAAVVPPEQAVDSSLSFMIGEFIDKWGDSASGYVVEESAEGNAQVEAQRFGEMLDRAEDDGVKTLVIGTAFGLASCLKRTEREWALPRGSQVIETGGFKGHHRELSRDELYNWFDHRLGLAGGDRMSEYSMTELSSQAYTPWRLAARREGLQLVVDGPSTARVFWLPPWARIELRDARTLEPIASTARPPEAGNSVEGLIRWYDLANVGSVQAIQTADRGRLRADGTLELLGRAKGADLRGCSLTVEESLPSDGADTGSGGPDG